MTTKAEMLELLQRLYRERPDEFPRFVRRIRRVLSRELVAESLAASARAAKEARP